VVVQRPCTLPRQYRCSLKLTIDQCYSKWKWWASENFDAFAGCSKSKYVRKFAIHKLCYSTEVHSLTALFVSTTLPSKVDHDLKSRQGRPGYARGPWHHCVRQIMFDVIDTAPRISLPLRNLDLRQQRVPVQRSIRRRARHEVLICIFKAWCLLCLAIMALTI
jgi:hypothetical protein